MSSVSDKSSVLLPVCLIIIAMISVQSGASLAKLLFPLVGAEGATSLRLGFGTLVLTLVYKPWRTPMTPGSLLPMLVYGLVLGGMNFLFYQSIKTLPLGIAVALEFTGPLAVAIFSSRRPIDFLWIILAMLGLLVLLPIFANHTDINLKGALYAISAGACWALYIVYGKKAGIKNGQSTVAIGTLIAAVFFCPIGIAQNGSALFQLPILPIALGVGILSTALPFSLEMMALRRIPSRTFGTLMSLEPAIGALSGLIILQEHLTLQQWGGMLAIMVASVGATLTIKPASKKKK
ncbi:threonine/homoserine exporter RhtA [uncultured Tolumonas sp.]|uniref:threonine/homoserine exporter RhtA n=1 Tax=uncultured Tolumonas sp. TaxID=263765 RepID=UPI002A0A9AD5|nr:threonine/homoserine exporter RhtA [uncultured Tolumonas sp.]